MKPSTTPTSTTTTAAVTISSRSVAFVKHRGWMAVGAIRRDTTRLLSVMTTASAGDLLACLLGLGVVHGTRKSKPAKAKEAYLPIIHLQRLFSGFPHCLQYP